MSKPATLTDTCSATSSPASVAGPTHSPLLDGPQTGLFGQDRAHASRSAWLEAAEENPTDDTCGLSFGDLSQSAILQSSLENKLRHRLEKYGFVPCDLIWSKWLEDSPLPVCALMPLARHTKGCERFGIPTPQAMDAKGYSDALRHKYRKTGHLKHWTHGTALAIHSSSGKSSWPNPAFAEWLMGYPPAWLCALRCAATAMRSCQPLRRSSSLR